MDKVREKRSGGIKARGSVRGLATDRRRARQLEIQRKRRRDMSNHARKLALANLEELEHASGPLVPAFDVQQKDVGSATASGAASMCIDLPTSFGGGKGSRGRKGRRGENKESRKAFILKHRAKCKFYRSQLMTPEWMTDIPSSLGPADWFVIPRPTGRRCLVIASRGRTMSYSDKDGNVMHKFFSLLPSGSKKTVQGTAGYTILDCVYNAKTHTYIVLDLMCWRGHQVYDCTAEFRITWLQSKLKEEFGGALQARGPDNKFRFEAAAFFNCDVGGFMQAYSRCKLPYDREGLIFVHKQGLYELGVNPLVVRWKDAMTSQYFVDTTGSGAQTKLQSVILRADKDGTFRTMDNAILGKFGPKFAQEKKLTPGGLVRVLISGVKYDATDDAPPKLLGVQFKGFGSGSRLYADTVSKILFQHMARNGTLITVKHIGTDLSRKKSVDILRPPPSLPVAVPSAPAASHSMEMDMDTETGADDAASALDW